VKTFRRGVRLGSPESRELGDIRGFRTETAFDERRKRILMLRAEGGLVNPGRHPLLESHPTALSGSAEPRRAYTRPLPHIRQANSHVVQPD